MNNHKMKSTISDFLIVSFNCRGLSSSLLEIQELCKSHDVILLQETWLAKQQLHSLSSIHDDFLFHFPSSRSMQKVPTKRRFFHFFFLLVLFDGSGRWSDDWSTTWWHCCSVEKITHCLPRK